jgi:hypothetical protein
MGKALALCAVAVLFPFGLQAHVLVETIASDEHGVVLEFLMEGYVSHSSWERGTLYQRISLPGAGRSSQEGLPEVPVTGRLIGIPEGAAPKVTVLASEYEALTHTLAFPSPRKVRTEANGTGRITEAFHRNEGAYRSDAFLPEALAEIRPAGYLRELPAAHLVVHLAQANPVRKEVRLLTRIRLRVDYGVSLRNRTERRTETGPPDSYERMLSGLIVNYDALGTYPGARTGARANSTGLTDAWVPLKGDAGDGDAAKLGVDVAGIYAVGYDDLAGAGYDPTGIDPRNLHLENKGAEIPMVVEGEEDGVFDPWDTLLFYGQPEDTIYTDTNVYWLYADQTPGLRMQVRDVTPEGSAPVLTSFLNTIHVEENRTYYQNPQEGESADHWYWDRLLAPAVKVYTVHLANISSEPNTGTLRFSLTGNTGTEVNPDHHTLLEINGNTVDDAYWDGFVTYVHEVPVAQSQLLEGDNAVRITAPGNTGSVVDGFYTNWIEVEYLDTYTAEDDLLAFNGSGVGAFGLAVSGFSVEEVEIFDITDPTAPVLLSGPTVTQEGAFYSAVFEDTLDGRTDYIALSPDRREAPASMELDEPSDLRSGSNGADYILITTQPLLGPAQALADHRAGQGLRVHVVEVDDIYDEFNHGIMSPLAIKDFLQYAYENWAPPAPLYVCLFGDATYDFKDHLNEGFLYPLPAMVVDRLPRGQTPVDHPYACVSGGDDLPDLFLGRISTRSAYFGFEIVQKLTAYESLDQSLWMRRAIFAADEGEEFATLSDGMIESSVPDEYLPRRIYLDDYGAQERLRAASHLRSAINGGALTTTYTGHGSMGGWSPSHLLRSDEIEQLENNHLWTFVVVASCNNGFFGHPVTHLSMAELFLQFPDRGSIASFSPIGLSYVYPDAKIVDDLFQQLLVDRNTELGAATTAAKVSAFVHSGVGIDHIENYEYFGDPALSLKVEDPDADDDQDGHINRVDNCPFTENPGQEDAEEDGWGDPCDNCPAAPNPDQIDSDNDGLGDLCDPDPDPGPCFIATAAFGHSLEGKVRVLRQFRDHVLVKTGFGRCLVQAYYAYSPPVARYILEQGWRRATVRLLLLPVVGFVSLLV